MMVELEWDSSDDFNIFLREPGGAVIRMFNKGSRRPSWQG